MKKTYLILGDNNFWYAFETTKRRAIKRINELKSGIDVPEDEPSKANDFFLYEVIGERETFKNG